MNQELKEKFEKWALSYCGGFDHFNEKEGLFWSCGLEWGGNFDDLVKSLDSNQLSDCRGGHENIGESLGYPYNWNLAKVLAYMEDYEDYKKFANDNQLWLKGSKYNKLNLYPLAAKNMDTWPEHYKELFDTKESYYIWCREKRFPWLKKLMKQYKPKIILCTGITYVDEFKDAWIDESLVEDKGVFKLENISQEIEYWQLSHNEKQKTLVAVTYFPGGPNGINSDEKAKHVGEALKSLLNKYHI